MFLIIEKTIISFGGIMIWIYSKLHLLIQIKYGKLLVSRGTAPFLKNANPPGYYIEKNRENQSLTNEFYSNNLHDALLKKNGKCLCNC